MTNKEKIIQLFIEKVKGKIPNIETSNQHHDGKRSTNHIFQLLI